MKILITGGAGFIGSNLADRLIKEGHEVVVVDRLCAGNKKNLNSNAGFFKCDVSDPKISNIFSQVRPEIVYHIAGPINLRRKIDDPILNNSLDILGGIKMVLDCCRNEFVKKIIFTSSGGAVYGGAKIVPTPENYPAHPFSLYGLACLILEKFIEEYCKHYDLEFIILRLSNVYGPRQWGSGVIPSFIVALMDNRSPIICGSGRETRDYIFIDDVVEALLLSAKNDKGGTFNVGSGREVSVNQVFEIISKILNKKINPEYISSRDTEISRNALDCDKIKRDLSWEPRVSFFHGCEKTVRHYINRQAKQ